MNVSLFENLPDDILEDVIGNMMIEQMQSQRIRASKRAVVAQLDDMVKYHKVWRDGLEDDNWYVDEHGVEWKDFLFEADWISVKHTWFKEQAKLHGDSLLPVAWVPDDDEE